MPSSGNVHSQVAEAKTDRPKTDGWGSAATVRDVVVTLMAKTDELVALKGWFAGTMQVAPVGAPVQVTDADPPMPAPPIERL
jgi:hypothetical protein